MFVKKPRFSFVLWVGVIGLALVNSFVNLGNFEVEIWDEARHALNAYEMLKSGQYIGMTYDGGLDYWNLKPPLGTWFIVLGYKLFGVNLWGLRFFSAFFTVLTVVFTMLIGKRLGEKTALTAGLVLSTMYAFLAFHTGRTADYDAHMAFFMTLCVWGMVNWAEGKRWGLWLASLMVSFSFLLKSFSAAMPAFFIFLVVVTEKRYKKLGVGDVVFSLVLMGAPVIAWAIARYQVDGLTFFQKMVGYDLVARSSQAIEGHPGSNLHYLEPIFTKTLLWSLFLFFVVPFMGFAFRWKREENGYSFYLQGSGFGPSLFWFWMLATLLFPFLVKTKSDWYLNPFYPALSVFLAWHFWEGKSSYPWVQKLMARRKQILFVMGVVTEILIVLLVVSPAEWVFATKIRYYPSYQRVLLSFWKKNDRPREAVLFTPTFVEQDMRFIVQGLLEYRFGSLDDLAKPLPETTVKLFGGTMRDIEEFRRRYPEIFETSVVVSRHDDWVLVKLK
ncbi:ArnT family glycosyltransferase [Thermospira aquatica]|uniref:Glycosyltransferase family 39 protein n=1 Tax=Thermospira aquatica TaxID=2828656 RepID=A0AAX3BF42_9SPIR|nr:glycosyltransferase family 39 protein [Thermospira aquatica]URA10841.1 glycosyltransferase family 39 protein [Thermospira aquatica]